MISFRRVSLIFVFLSALNGAWASSSRMGSPRCEQVLAQNGHQFEFADPRLKMRRSEPVFLGEGVWGKVYLLGDAQAGWRVEKLYRDQGQMQKDLRALQFLRQQINHSLLGSIRFRVAEAQRLDSLKMGLKYYPGRTVQDVFEDKSSAAELRQRVRDSYLGLLKKMISFFEGEEFLIDVNKADLPRVSAQNDSYAMGGYHFIIKPDNILLDPETLEMTLIDPN